MLSLESNFKEVMDAIVTKKSVEFTVSEGYVLPEVYETLDNNFKSKPLMIACKMDKIIALASTNGIGGDFDYLSLMGNLNVADCRIKKHNDGAEINIKF